MFNLSKKTNYGLELMIYLSSISKRKPVSLKQIADEKDFPLKYLEQVALKLKEAGLLSSKEGKGGGYNLAYKPSEITVADVVEVLEGPVEVGACMGCPSASMCSQKSIWQDLGEKTREIMEEKTLADLVKNEK
jgi:Rrf2 family transcriptional regulator, cysteine metabolism repressor